MHSSVTALATVSRAPDMDPAASTHLQIFHYWNLMHKQIFCGVPRTWTLQPPHIFKLFIVQMLLSNVQTNLLWDFARKGGKDLPDV